MWRRGCEGDGFFTHVAVYNLMMTDKQLFARLFRKCARLARLPKVVAGFHRPKKGGTVSTVRGLIHLSAIW